MSSTHVIPAQPRSTTGTGAARATRRQGLVPGIIYGNSQAPEMISVDPKVLLKEIHTTGFFSRLFTVSVDGKDQAVLAKDIQLHPVTDQPLHIDFQRVSKNSKIHVFIPVSFINEDKSPGVKRGGIVNVVHHTLEVICSPTDIPEVLTVDLTGFEANQAVHISDLKLPKGVEAAHPERDNTIATIVPPSSAEEPAEASAG